MGNECQTMCIDPQLGPSDSMSSIIKAIQKSEPMIGQFPKERIPSFVLQKLSKQGLLFNLDESQKMWKFQQDQCSSGLIIADKKQSANETKSNGSKETIDLKPEQNIFIYFFNQQRAQQLPLDTEYDKFGVLLPKFDKVYYGPVNKTMIIQQGIVINANGETYKGNLASFNYQGNHGVLSNQAETHIYEGEWKEGKPHGFGFQTRDREFIYEGNFSKGVWNGNGKLIIKNQQQPLQYIGNFCNGLLQGQGRIQSQGKIIYQGQFLHGKQHGHGRWQHNRQSYQGDYVDGVRQGKGVYDFGKDLVYSGDFKAGKPHGQGIMRSGFNKISGYWVEGQNVLVNDDGPDSDDF